MKFIKQNVWNHMTNLEKLSCFKSSPQEEKLHWGCGKFPMAGWANVDFMPEVNPDQVVNLKQFPLPWADNSIQVIHSRNLLEHIDETVPLMKEVWRILKPGGYFSAEVPYATSRVYLNDPDHRRPWTEYTVRYFDIDRDDAWFGCCCHGSTTMKWGFNVIRNDKIQLERIGTDFSLQRWVRNHLPFKEQLNEVLLGMFDELHFILQKPFAPKL